jgi:hypothetical protein
MNTKKIRFYIIKLCSLKMLSFEKQLLKWRSYVNCTGWEIILFQGGSAMISISEPNEFYTK